MPRGIYKRKSLVERYHNRIEKRNDSACWEWIGARDSDGYGHITIKIDGKTKWIKAHRLSWEYAFGNIPDHTCVLHHCDNPSCVNPVHLFLGTQEDNMHDMKSKGRSSKRSRVGEDNGNSKLKEIQVLDISKDNRTLREISQQYGVTMATVSDIKRGKIWSHLRIKDASASVS